MPRQKGTNYWGDKQEALCCQWISASTQQQYTHIYEALSGSINYMVGQIMQRYFTVNQSIYKDVMTETVNHVFMRLSKYKCNGKSYSFCGTVARNYIHEMLVTKPKAVHNIKIDYSDENYIIDGDTGIDYGEHREYDFKAILEWFDKKHAEIQLKKDKLKKRKKNYKTQQELFGYTHLQNKYSKHLETVRLSKEFIEKYESLDSNSMAEYVFLNSNFKRVTVVGYMKAVFGLHITIRSDEHIASIETRGYTFFNDDWTPMENPFEKRYTATYKKKTGRTFIDERYRYF